MKKGSDVNRKGCPNSNALNQLVLYAWDADFAAYLVRQGCWLQATARDQETLLESAASVNNCEAIAFLLAQGIEQGSIGKALCWAIIYNAVDAVRCLLANGADIAAMYAGCKGVEKSLYHMVLAWDNRGSRQAMIRVLLEAGVDFKQPPARAITLGLEKTKRSPYDYACEKRQAQPEHTFMQENLALVDQWVMLKA